MRSSSGEPETEKIFVDLASQETGFALQAKAMVKIIADSDGKHFVI